MKAQPCIKTGCKHMNTAMKSISRLEITNVSVLVSLHLDSLNHCIMDSLVLLANEEDMLNIMHSYGFENLFQIINFQRYIKETDEELQKMVYKSFMGEVKLSDKTTIVLNQIIAVLGGDDIKLEVENPDEEKEENEEEVKEENKEEAKEDNKEKSKEENNEVNEKEPIAESKPEQASEPALESEVKPEKPAAEPQADPATSSTDPKTE